jgi:hypothetical protein
LLLVALFVLIAYTFLHELGHALLGVLFGARLTSFNANFFDWSAHVGFAASLSAFEQSLVSLAGVALPLLIWLVFILLVPVQACWTMQWLKLLSSLGVLSSLLAWVVIPLVVANALAHGQTIADDSATFTQVTGAPGWLVSLAALLVYLAGMSLAYFRLGKRQALRGLSLRNPQAQALQRQDWRLLAVLAVLGLLLAVSSALLEAAVNKSALGEVPAGFALAGQVALERQDHKRLTIATFSLEQPTSVALFVRLQDYESGPMELALVGSQGSYHPIMSAEQSLEAGLATFEMPAQELAPGDYEVLLSAHQGRGRIWIYVQE